MKLFNYSYLALSEDEGNKKVISIKAVRKGETIHIISGSISLLPDKYTIEIKEWGIHIYDPILKGANHSFSPNIVRDGMRFVALEDIDIGEEVTFNYKENESIITHPFSDRDTNQLIE